MSSVRLAKALSYLGYNVHIVSYDKARALDQIPKECKVTVLNCPLVKEFSPDTRFFSIKRLLSVFVAGFKFAAVYKSEKPDLVFSLMYIPNFLNVIINQIFKRVGVNSGCEIVVSERQNPQRDLSLRTVNNVLTYFFARKLYPLATLVHANSTDMVNILRESYGEVDVVHFPNFFFKNEIVERARGQVEPGVVSKKRFIVTSGRLCKQKGQWWLIRAFQILRHDYGYDGCLVIVGDGELRPLLEKLVEDLSISEFVVFLGNLSNPFPVIAQSELFVFPSIWESFGNSLVEAMLLGIPSVATSCSGPASILPKHHRFQTPLLTFEDYKAMMSSDPEQVRDIDRSLACEISVFLNKLDELAEDQREISSRYEFESQKEALNSLFG